MSHALRMDRLCIKEKGSFRFISVPQQDEYYGKKEKEKQKEQIIKDD